MNRQETVRLTHVVMNLCPQQQINEYTPDSWHPVLGDLEFGDCCTAVQNLGRTQVFIAPAEVRAEVRRMRGERISRSLIAAPPAELCDDPRAYQKALQEGIRQAADGHGDPVTGQPPAVVGDNPRRQISVREDLPSLRDGIAGLQRALPRPRPATIPDEQRALEQAELARAERQAREAAAEPASDETGREAS